MPIPAVIVEGGRDQHHLCCLCLSHVIIGELLALFKFDLLAVLFPEYLVRTRGVPGPVSDTGH